MKKDTVEHMLHVAKQAKIKTVDKAIGNYLAKHVGNEDTFLADLYRLGLDTEENGNLSVEVAEQKLFKKVLAK